MSTATEAPAPAMTWKQAVAQYRKPVLRKSIWQLANTIGPLVILWVAMIQLMSISYLLVLPVMVLAAGFMVRLFIIFHDCTHNNFFKGKKANQIVGRILGPIVFTAYYNWGHDHAVHHANAGNLDHRDIGDVWTLTVDEYRDAPKMKRFFYRIYRSPWLMFTIIPFIGFAIVYRFPFRKTLNTRQRRSVRWTNVSIVAWSAIMCLLVGVKTFFIIQVPVLALSASAGLWLFYVQHQFEGCYWERDTDWDFELAGMEGSSFYKLPKVLQWFTGNIGFHHIHHLAPNIPNYNLEACHNSCKDFQAVPPLTLRTSLTCANLNLYDEGNDRMVPFSVVSKAATPA